MPTFSYVARDDAGKLVEGEISAGSPQEAARTIRGEGRYVVRVVPKGSKPVSKKAGKPAISITPASASTAAAAKAPVGDKYRPEDLVYFTNQLAVMIETGVSMSEALEACEHGENSPRFARALRSVIDRVQGGSEFSAALAEHPRVFPTLYVSLVRASEASGKMAPILRRLAEHLQTQRETRKRIKGAVTYPIVMFVFAIGVTVFLLTFVLPKFSKIYQGREDRLPKITRLLLEFSETLKAAGPYLGGALVVVIIGLIYYLRTPRGKNTWDTIRLHIPLIGPMYHKAFLSRSLRTLGTMIQSGVSMLDSVRLTSGVCGSAYYERMWTNVNDRLETGQQISEALSDYKQVPKAINKMLSSGERSGQLGPVMERVAEFCEAELNTNIKTLTSLIEPAIVMVLGAVVGGLVLALLLPIFTISRAMH